MMPIFYRQQRTSVQATMCSLTSLSAFNSSSSVLGFMPKFLRPEDMVEILVKIMAEIISILSITTKEMQQSGASRLFLLDTLISIWPILDSMIPLETYLKKLMGGKDIEDALKRLDNLTREEFQMAIAQVLKAMNQLTDGAQPH